MGGIAIQGEVRAVSPKKTKVASCDWASQPRSSAAGQQLEERA
jgi:hypothetical protein